MIHDHPPGFRTGCPICALESAKNTPAVAANQVDASRWRVTTEHAKYEERVTRDFAASTGIGFGRLMQLGQQLWREHLEASGYPTGGEFSIGPCVAMTVPCQCIEAEEPQLDANGHCDWCCGARRVTRRVRAMQASESPAVAAVEATATTGRVEVLFHPTGGSTVIRHANGCATPNCLGCGVAGVATEPLDEGMKYAHQLLDEEGRFEMRRHNLLKVAAKTVELFGEVDRLRALLTMPEHRVRMMAETDRATAKSLDATREKLWALLDEATKIATPRHRNMEEVRADADRIAAIRLEAGL